MNNRFLSYLEDISNRINKSIENNENFLIFSSLNPDGIASSILLINYLYKKDAEIHLTYIDYIKKDKVKEIFFGENSYEYNNMIFIDNGSLFSDEVVKINKDSKKNVYIIDHHFIGSKDLELNNVVNLNPNLFNIDGNKEISTSNIIYYLVKNIYPHARDLLYLSLVGNIYDFFNINTEILKELEDNDIIQKTSGINLPGIFTKPFYKSLSSSFNFFIPNITGSDEKALNILKELNIDNKGIANIVYQDLSEEDLKKLVSNIIKIKIKYNLQRTEDLIGDVYKINKNGEIGDLLELLYSIEGIIENEKKEGILYFLKKYSIDIIKDSESYLRNNFSKLLYDIIEGKIDIKDENGLKIINIEKNYGNGYYLPLLINLIIKEKILEGKVFLIIYKINDNLYRGIIKTNKEENKRIINNIIKKLFENNLIYYSSFDNFGGFVIEKNNYENFLKNIKINLRQENII